MIVKNQTHKPVTEINKLIDWVVDNFQPLIDDDIEIHIRTFNGKGDMFGISFYGLDLKIDGQQTKVEHGYLIHNVEPTSKQLAIVYITKHPEKYIAFKHIEGITWQEAFVITLVHELRHLWFDRKLKGREEDDDVRYYEQKALKKYRKAHETNKATHT